MCFTAAKNSATPAKTSLMVSDPVFPRVGRFKQPFSLKYARRIRAGWQPVADHPDATQRGVALRTTNRAVRNCIDIFYRSNMKKRFHISHEKYPYLS